MNPDSIPELEPWTTVWQSVQKSDHHPLYFFLGEIITSSHPSLLQRTFQISVSYPRFFFRQNVLFFGWSISTLPSWWPIKMSSKNATLVLRTKKGRYNISPWSYCHFNYLAHSQKNVLEMLPFLFVCGNIVGSLKSWRPWSRDAIWLLNTTGINTFMNHLNLL